MNKCPDCFFSAKMFLISIYDNIYNIKYLLDYIRGEREMDLTKLWHVG